MTQKELDKAIKLLNIKASVIRNAIHQGWLEEYRENQKDQLYAQIYFAEQLTNKVIECNETTWRVDYVKE